MLRTVRLQMPHPMREGKTLDICAVMDTDFNAVLKKLRLQATAHSQHGQGSMA